MCTVTNFEPKQRMQSILRTPWTSSTPSSGLHGRGKAVRWRAESVLDGQGPGIPHRRGHIAGGCFIGRRGWLWTSTPVWYSEFVHSSQAHRLGWKTGAQQLTLFVSRNTAQGLRTGKLYQSRDADIDGLETNFFSGAEMGGTEEPCYEINPVMFCADDENCGHVHTDIVDVYEEMPCDGEREY